MMRMLWWQNIPLFLIVAPLMGAVVCSALKEKAARGVMTALSALTVCGMALVLAFTAARQESCVYPMGEVGAPFGNELRFGAVEGIAGLGFSLVILLSVLGGWRSLTRDVPENKRHLYAAMVCLLTAAMSAMVFTNDLFTAYVFIEITTIASCALISATDHGRTLFGAARYMLMNLLGSGLFLLGVSTLYCLTGHLLFPQLQESVKDLLDRDKYLTPLYLSFVLMTLGIAIKSALYPFHTWLPNAYASTTPTSSALLSSLISKMYIFLLIKIFFRAAGAQVFDRDIRNFLLGFAVAGMVLGSVDAIVERHLSRMVAYSSVAQIGYIFLGISLGTEAGMAAALFHMLVHAAAKCMLFLSAGKLREVSGMGDGFRDVRGAGFRAPLAGAAFAAGACSLVGVPLLGGFPSKIYLAQAGIALGGWRMGVVLAALAVSTALHVMYMLRTAVLLYAGDGDARRPEKSPLRKDPCFTAAMLALLGLNVLLGIGSRPIMEAILQGIALFS